MLGEQWNSGVFIEKCVTRSYFYHPSSWTGLQVHGAGLELVRVLLSAPWFSAHWRAPSAAGTDFPTVTGEVRGETWALLRTLRIPREGGKLQLYRRSPSCPRPRSRPVTRLWTREGELSSILPLGSSGHIKSSCRTFPPIRTSPRLYWLSVPSWGLCRQRVHRATESHDQFTWCCVCVRVCAHTRVSMYASWPKTQRRLWLCDFNKGGFIVKVMWRLCDFNKGGGGAFRIPFLPTETIERRLEASVSSL